MSLIIINVAPELELLFRLNFHFLDYDSLKISLKQFSYQSVIASFFNNDKGSLCINFKDELLTPSLEYT